MGLKDCLCLQSARDTLMIGSEQQRWNGLASRNEMLKSRRQEKEDAARRCVFSRVLFALSLSRGFCSLIFALVFWAGGTTTIARRSRRRVA